jgi:DNA-binding XRE family transcriptional regulator
MADRPRRPRIQGPGLALKAARLRSGYRSTAEAAIALGMSENTVRAHESGKRKISKAHASVYASAFRVEKAMFMQEVKFKEELALRREVQSLLEPDTSASDRRSDQSARLRFARLMRGHTTLSAAARELGLSRGTAGSHENGYSLLSEETLNAYALAYGVNVKWLDSGEGPSGLGPGVDVKIRSAKVRDLADLAQHLDASPLAISNEDRAAARNALRDAMASFSLGGRLREVGFRANGQICASEPHQIWMVPQEPLSLLAKQKAKKLVVVPLSSQYRDWKAGDRVFIDLGQYDAPKGGLFAYHDGEKGVSLVEHRPMHSGRGKPIGKVVAVFHFM